MKYLHSLFLISAIALFGFDSKGITNGVDLANEDYPAVVLIEDMENQTIGTGVVVGNGTILTAHHCVPHENPKSIRINGEYVVTEISVRKYENEEIALDLALLRVVPNKFKNILPIAQFQLPPRPFPISIIGYGLSYKEEMPLTYDDSTTKRIGKNIISTEPIAVTSLYLNIRFEWEPFDLSKPSGALPGDSGGPMLLNDAVIGIASKSVAVSNYVNLLGPRAQKFLSEAVANGWQIEFAAGN